MSDSGPVLFLIGASHRTASMEAREKLSLSGGKLEQLQHSLRALAGLREHTVLSTCNRMEVYGVADRSAAVEELQALLCGIGGMEAQAFERIRLRESGRAAIQHLLEVAAGVDSQMVGETEILGQVKEAYAKAQAAGATGAVLNRVFQKAFQAAKQVRTDTAIGEGQISVASVAVELAQKIFGDLCRCRVLVLGAGEIGEKTAKAFRSRRAADMTVASRRLDRAGELAAALGAKAAPFEQLPALLAESDIVVCSTAAPEAVVTPAIAGAALRHRAARPLFLIDLGLPRNVAPEVVELPNAFLYNLDDLARIAEENLAHRQAEISRARALLAGKAAALWDQVAARVGGSGGHTAA